MVGRTVLQYQFLEKLGSGGMGEIYKAQDTKLNRFVAIKVLPSDKSGDPERRRRFIQEAQAASALNHPNIITIHDIITEGDTQYMVMEFVPGRTLLDLIPTGGMPVSQVLQYSTQMADALTTAHAAGIIHRDFKPANVMVNNSGLIKVLDFGLAKLTERGSGSAFDPDATASEAPITVEGSIMGTVSYMSPEQAEGKRVDARSDIFSFGSVLYEMVTGRRAFHGDSGISTLTAVLRDDIKPIGEVAPDVPPLLEVIIARCLNKDPDSRWQAMKEVGDALTSLRRTLDTGLVSHPAAVATAVPTTPAPSAGQPPKTPPKTPPDATKKPNGTASGTSAQKSSTGLVLALVGVLAIGIAAGAYFYFRPKPPVVISDNKTTDKTTTEAPPITPAKDTNAPTTAAPSTESSSKPPTQTQKKSTEPPAQTKSPASSATTSSEKATTSAKTTNAPPKPPQPVPPAPAPQVQKVPVVVADSLPFRITIDADVPVNAEGGQTLEFTVTDGLQVNGNVVIAKGAKVTGSIIGEVGTKIMGIGSKKMNFRLLQAETVDGAKVNVRATPAHGSKGGPAIHPFDTGKGSKSKDLAAKAGTEYYAYTDGEQTVMVRK